MTSTPAGWYDDGRGATRWWDGAQWTEHTQPAEHPQPAEHVRPAADTQPAEHAQPAAVETTSAPFSGTAAALAPVAPAKRSWLIPVILGVSFLLLVLLAVIFIPMLVKTMATGGYAGDELKAVETVRAYDDAWQSGDCDGFEATTTEDLRTETSLADCATFEEASAGFQEATDAYELAVTDVTSESGVITVRTEETYTSYLDEEDNPVPGYDAVSTVDYTVIESDGEWLVDSASYLEE